MRRWNYARPHKGYGWFAGHNAWYATRNFQGWVMQHEQSLAKYAFHHFKPLIFASILITAVLLVPAGLGYSIMPSSQLIPLPCQGEFRAVGAPCQDPTTLIWQRSAAAPSDLTDFFTGPPTTAYITSCGFSAGTDCVSLNPASGNDSVVITKRPVGDLSLGVAKTLAFVAGYKMVGNGFTTGQARHWGFFITTNGTAAPQHDIGSTAVYNPLDDPSVLLAEEVWCTSGTCGSAGQTATYNTFVWINKAPGTGKSISQQEDSSNTCTSGGSCFVSIVSNNGPSGCFAPCNADPQSANALGVYLNFTGQVNTSGCSVGSTTFNGPGCSWVFDFAAAQTPLGTGETGTQLIPQNVFTGGGQYYEGFFSTVAGFPIQFFFAPGPAISVGGNTGMDIFDYIPSPTASIVPPNLDSGGFIGSIFNHYVNGWSQVCSVLAIASYCASIYQSASSAGGSLETAVVQGLLVAGAAITSALSFIEGLVQTVLNAVGSAFGFPTLGTTIFTFINSLITVFTTAVPNAFAQIVNIFNGWLNALTIVFTTGIIGQVFSYLSSILTFGVNIAVFAFSVFTTGLSWTTIFVPFWMFIWFFGFNADEGMDGWIRWFDFAKWLAFDIGVKTVTLVINWTIDVITALMALLPKPFVNMAGRFPRVPILEIHGSFSTPSFDGRALREGNLFSVLGMLGGFIGFVWYELTQSSIPGTLANEFMGQPFIQGATTAIVFYKLFLPMAVLTVFLLMIPTLFTSIFGVIVPGPSVAFPTLGSRPRRGVSIQGGRGPLIRKVAPGKRSSSFIKGRLEKIEGKEKESKRLRNEREEEARNALAAKKQREQDESARRNEQAKKQAQESERQRRESSVAKDEAMFGQ